MNLIKNAGKEVDTRDVRSEITVKRGFVTTDAKGIRLIKPYIVVSLDDGDNYYDINQLIDVLERIRQYTSVDHAFK